jgi:hypothetical protein
MSMLATSSSPGDGIRESLEDEARRLLAAADADSLPLGLLGGMGIRLLLGERIDPRFRREIGDLDFITTRRAGAAVETLLAAHGWQPARHFNAVNGARRLLFEEPAGTRRVDVFVGGFQMCHQLPLVECLHGRAEILPAAELALTKLQIVALNAKDRGDLYALLLACRLAGHGANLDAAHNGRCSAEPDVERSADPTIDVHRITELTSADWGLHHTVELNLARLREGLTETGLEDAQRALLRERIAALTDALERASKSRAWRLRARIGERRRWFEEPEEIAR